MNFKQAIQELIDAGFTEEQIAAAVRTRGADCTQSTVNRLKRGLIAEPRFSLGSALLDVHAAALFKPRGHRSVAASPPPAA